MLYAFRRCLGRLLPTTPRRVLGTGAGFAPWAGGSLTPGPSFCLRCWTARLLATGVRSTGEGAGSCRPGQPPPAAAEARQRADAQPATSLGRSASWLGFG